ncbi:hypothetical protein NL364_29970, partial [Klebsiella pneumoniae]|nr:hypothetical protein [Klebsiella pneumoniae]
FTLNGSLDWIGLRRRRKKNAIICRGKRVFPPDLAFIERLVFVFQRCLLVEVYGCGSLELSVSGPH